MVFLLSPTQHPAPHSSGFVHLSGMLRGQFSAFFLSYLYFSEDCLSIFFPALPPLSPIYPVEVSVWMPPTRLEPNMSNMIFFSLFLSINLPINLDKQSPWAGLWKPK